MSRITVDEEEKKQNNHQNRNKLGEKFLGFGQDRRDGSSYLPPSSSHSSSHAGATQRWYLLWGAPSCLNGGHRSSKPMPGLPGGSGMLHL